MARRPNVRAPPTILIKSTIPTLISLPREGRGREISRILQVSIGTVNIDLSILRQQAKENIRKYIDEKLPEEYEKCLVGCMAEDKREDVQH